MTFGDYEGIPFLIDESGTGFTDEIINLREKFATLSNAARKKYRKENATAIANCDESRLLVVAGPGTGKSYLFRDRIKYWLHKNEDAEIYVSSFVRKLVLDLKTEIENDPEITAKHNARLTVSTLHTLARSLIERAKGTSHHRLRSHVRVIPREWEDVVWNDVLQFRPELIAGGFTFSNLAHQYHVEEMIDDPNWRDLEELYRNLCRFYNAAGFAHMIVLAREVIVEDSSWSNHLFWIVDEYQDLNPAEDHLVRTLTQHVDGVLIAGDDDQALYQILKASLSKIIITYYEGSEYVNGMLPFCGRCTYYICLAASEFIQRYRADFGIDKVFLPVEVNLNAAKIQVVAVSQPTAAVDYIARFIDSHRAEIDTYTEQMRAGLEVDPYLLILTPQKNVGFFAYQGADQQLQRLLSEFTDIQIGRSKDYLKIATFCMVAWEPNDNLATRKALHYQEVSATRVHELLEIAMSRNCALSDLHDQSGIGELKVTAEAIGNVMNDSTLDSVDKCSKFANFILMDDMVMLASELTKYPFDLQSVFKIEENQEAVETAKDVAAVEMMTFYKSKGLSAQHVIVIGCDDENLKKTVPLTFFVGMTRARQSLHLITSMKARGTRAADYVLDLPPKYCDYIKYLKTGRVLTTLPSKQAFIDCFLNWNLSSHRASVGSYGNRE